MKLRERIETSLASLPKPVAVFLPHLISLAAGLLVAFVIHYVLYRVGLPLKPFIYVSF